MSEPPKYFRSFREIESRPDFDLECGISVETFGSLVGEYHCVADEERPCQVERGGKRCNEGHKNGWVARTKAGKEALLGIVCGTKYFNANSEFVSERGRVRRELNIDSYIERLKATLGNPEYIADVDRGLGRLRAVRSATKDVEDQLPSTIAYRLRMMAKVKNAGIGVLFRYDDDEDDDGNPKVSWVPQQVGAIEGITLWDEAELRSVFTLLHEIRDTVRDGRIERTAGQRRLKQWCEKLAELPPCIARIEALESALEAFTTPQNLRLLCLAVPNQNDCLVAAQIALKHEGELASRGGAQRLINQISTEIRGRAGGRSFRIDY